MGGDFLRSTYDVLSQTFSWIKPFVDIVVDGSSGLELLRTTTFEVEPTDGTLRFFNLTVGDVPSPGNSSLVKVPYEIFREILFIDFGRWFSSDELIAHLASLRHGQYANHARRFAPLCNAWYIVSYRAAELFFSRDANLQSYFSEEATTWWNGLSLATKRHSVYVTHLREWMDSHGKIVLDVGCGFGRLDPCFPGARILVSADVAVDMLKRITANHTKGARYLVQADAGRLPFKEKRFDVITALQVLMHLAEPFQCLGGMATLLKPQGEVWTDFTCTRRSLGERYYIQESFITRVYSRQYVIDQCEALGYAVIGEPKELQDRHDHYWLILRLRKRAK